MRRSPAAVLSAALLSALLVAGCSEGGATGPSAPDGGAGPGGVAEARPDGTRDTAHDDASSGGGGGAGNDGGDSGGGSTGGGTRGGGDGGTGGDSAEQGVPASPGTSATVISARVAARAALIRTGDLTVRVDDVRTAAQEAARVASGAGGSVQAEERSGDDRGGSALLVLRVPPTAFDAALGRLADLGEELDRRTGTQDVTEQVVDLESRIATQRASVARVRALLDRADDLGDVVLVEGELTERTADLEALQARLAALAEQVDLSTITLRLDGTDRPLPVGTAPGFRDGLSAGWNALVAAGRLLGAAVGALLPFSPLLVLGGLLVHRSRSRRAASA